MKNKPKYLIMSAAARMPSSCWGTYRRIAVVELAPGFEGRPKMISTRARGIVRVVQSWERLNCGKTDRDAYGYAMREAVALVATLEGRTI